MDFMFQVLTKQNALSIYWTFIPNKSKINSSKTKHIENTNSNMHTLALKPFPLKYFFNNIIEQSFTQGKKPQNIFSPTIFSLRMMLNNKLQRIKEKQGKNSS